VAGGRVANTSGFSLPNAKDCLLLVAGPINDYRLSFPETSKGEVSLLGLLEKGRAAMTDQVERVRDLVRRALVTDPNVTNKELFERAKEVAPEAVKDLTLLQFHARFRLPIIRNEMGPRERKPGERPSRRPRRRPAPRPAGSIRADLRELLVKFAVDLESASNRSELIRVVANVDKVIDDILALTRRVELPEPAPPAPAEPEPMPEPVAAPVPPEPRPSLAAASVRRPAPDPGRSMPTSRPAQSEHRWPPRPPNPFRDP
jgi:hypothetical protein